MQKNQAITFPLQHRATTFLQVAPYNNLVAPQLSPCKRETSVSVNNRNTHLGTEREKTHQCWPPSQPDPVAAKSCHRLFASQKLKTKKRRVLNTGASKDRQTHPQARPREEAKTLIDAGSKRQRREQKAEKVRMILSISLRNGDIQTTQTSHKRLRLPEQKTRTGSLLSSPISTVAPSDCRAAAFVHRRCAATAFPRQCVAAGLPRMVPLSGDLNGAHMMFDEMPHKNSVSTNMMLMG
ncbi:pentatricopeptide repeat-containing protein [Sesbania bispinosa]|nr:pentatricopeptide repeat-containing protein [Sesbania bispinosa]